MTVRVATSDGKKFIYDENGPASAYFVRDSGVLQILVLGADNKWKIVAEFAPAGWLKIEGTRFTASTVGLDGSDGSDTLRFSSVYENDGLTVV